MLLDLSLETILSICGHLEREDRLQLKLTCRKLDGFITKAIVFEEFDLLKFLRRGYFTDVCQETTDWVYETRVKGKIDGSLVKVLHLNIDRLSESDRSQIATLFPNIRRLITSRIKRESDKYYPPWDDFEVVTDPLITWRNTIEKIDTRYDWCEILYDLFSNGYPRLTELDILEFSGVTNFWKTSSMTPFSINAPLLTKVTLRNGYVDMKMLEALHRACPLITSLRLFNINFTGASRHKFPRNLVPANSVTYFALFESRNLYKNGIVLDYILKKYPNVQQLVYGVNTECDYSLKTFEQLKYTRGGNHNRIYAEIERSRESFPAYSAIELKFFSNLPRSLKRLTLDLNNIYDAVAGLSKSGTNITTLDLIGACKGSQGGVYDDRRTCDLFGIKRERQRVWKSVNRLKYLKKLTSLKTLRIRLHAKVRTYTSDYISLGITRLVVDVCGSVFFLDWLLDMFPSLEELYIYADDSQEADPDANELRLGKIYPKLRSLTIKSSPLNPKFFEFIKTSLPNLEELDLEISCLPPRSTFIRQIDLSGCHLNKCTLSFKSDDYGSNIHYTIKIGDASKCFAFTEPYNTLVPLDRSYKSARTTKYVEITCGDFKQMKLFDFHVAKIGDRIVIHP